MKYLTFRIFCRRTKYYVLQMLLDLPFIFLVQVMEMLLHHGANINAVNKGRCTALHIAAHKQPIHCVSLLLTRGADVNIQDSYGDTALHDAIGKESCSVIELLCESPGTCFFKKQLLEECYQKF